MSIEPIFRNDALNLWLGRLWTIPGGIPEPAFTLPLHS
jgi:hypothetical protein